MEIGNEEMHYPKRRHVSGLWLGQAVPDESFRDEVAVNPIKWSCSLVEGDEISLFGSGYFDDAGDIPGSPVAHASIQSCEYQSCFTFIQVLFFSLNGCWDTDTNAVEFEKVPAKL